MSLIFKFTKETTSLKIEMSLRLHQLSRNKDFIIKLAISLEFPFIYFISLNQPHLMRFNAFAVNI